MKILAISQARFSSSRLPGKVLLPLGTGTVLDLHLKRIKKSKLITDFAAATTNEPEAGQIEKIALQNDFSCFRGSLDDVLDRFYQCAKSVKPDLVVRLTSDCPLIDPYYIDDLIKNFLNKKVDYSANCLNPTLPDGMDAEIFSFAALESAWKEATKKSEREHVTLFIRNCGKFKIDSLEYPLDFGKFRLTLDTSEDYNLINKLVTKVGESGSMQDYIQCLIEHPEWLTINSQYERNEGLKKSLLKDN